MKALKLQIENSQEDAHGRTLWFDSIVDATEYIRKNIERINDSSSSSILRIAYNITLGKSQLIWAPLSSFVKWEDWVIRSRSSL